MKSNFILYLVSTLLFVQSLYARPLEVGDSWPLNSFNNQFDKQEEVTNDIQLLIFVAEMEPSKFVHEVLKNESAPSMKQKKIFFLSDIHKMPSLISRFIAIPKMKGYTYPIALIREEGVSVDLPREKGKVSLFYLASKKVNKIQFVASALELQNAIDSLPKSNP